MNPPDEGRPALEFWTVQALGSLYQHLHNGHGLFEWVMGFRDKTTGETRYVRSKRVPVDRGISWSLATVQWRKTPEGSLAFVPYSTNAAQMSRWGAMDFDAHDGNFERARRLAFAALPLLRDCETATILESSGSGGWHIWVIAPDFKPAAHWVRLLKNVARDIGTTIESGICEIFPSDTLSRGFGKGLRAPGAWNPRTGKFSLIHFENAGALIAGLPPCVSGKSARIGKVAFSSSETFPIQKEVSLSLSSLCVLGKLIGGAESFLISTKATRHERLQGLTGTAFHQVSRPVAEQLARAQFAEKTVATNADQAQHLADFASLWEGLEVRWRESLSAAERERYEELSTDAERAAFRIIRSYAHMAALDGRADFPIACENLGERIGITVQGAGQLRRKFVGLGIIGQTVPYRANVAAARFRWLLNPAQKFN